MKHTFKSSEIKTIIKEELERFSRNSLAAPRKLVAVLNPKSDSLEDMAAPLYLSGESLEHIMDVVNVISNDYVLDQKETSDEVFQSFHGELQE